MFSVFQSSGNANRRERASTHSVANDAGYFERIDPRARIVVAVLFSLITAEVRGFTALGIALAAALTAGAFSGLTVATLARRLLPLNALMLFLAFLLPLSMPGTPVAKIGPISFSQEGLILAAKIALKGNAIVLAVLVLIGTMEVNTLGHALSHLRVPASLAHLFLFTIRYMDVLHREYLRLRWAMKVRCYHPRMDRHTYRSVGNLLGMLLVRGFDRSERILAAMKCRGFQGRFYLLDHFSFQARDGFFCSLSLLIYFIILAAEFL
jgi:cobalt/nickel transport system permease protein